jgi:hypothetical protein
LPEVVGMVREEVVGELEGARVLPSAVECHGLDLQVLALVA